MTITVTAPNGATIDFPDGTDHATINGVMTQHFGGGAPPDPVGINDVARSAASGVPIVGGLLNKADAATNAALAPILNPLFAPKDQLSEPTFSERYAHSLRDQEGADTKFGQQHPIVDAGARITGGAAAMLPAMAAAPSLLGVTGSLGSRAMMGGASNAVIGGTDALVRGDNPVTGALVGGALGAGMPLATGALLHAAVNNPITSNLAARFDPKGFAQRQIARGISDSSLTPQQIGQRVTDAAAGGQPEFTVADAMGNSGQRMLSTVARAPGEGRTAVVDALNARQAGQGERVSNIIDEGLGTGSSARQTIDQLTQQARKESAPLYQEALNKKPVWSDRMQQFFDDPVTKSGLAEGVRVQRLESLASGQPFNPRDYAITGFNEAGDPIMSGVPNMRTINLIKKGFDNTLEGYRDGTTGRLNLDEYGRALDQVRRSFLGEVDSLNPAYAKARAMYAGPAQVRDAVNTGAQAATRGRAVDNVARFNGLTDPSKQGFRSGYADTLLGKLERQRLGADKTGPLSSPKAMDELAALSLHQGPVQPGSMEPMAQKLARERTMFETRNAALGGSKTADNLNDNAAMAIDPHLVGAVGHLLSGNIGGTVRSVGSLVANGWTGNTPQVRQEVARILLQRAPDMTPGALQKMVDQTISRLQRVKQLSSHISRGATGGITSQQNQR